MGMRRTLGDDAAQDDANRLSRGVRRRAASFRRGNRQSQDVPRVSEALLARKSARRNLYLFFDIFIRGNFRLTAATTAACSGFPELLAKASRP